MYSESEPLPTLPKLGETVSSSRAVVPTKAKDTPAALAQEAQARGIPLSYTTWNRRYREYKEKSKSNPMLIRDIL